MRKYKIIAFGSFDDNNDREQVRFLSMKKMIIYVLCFVLLLIGGLVYFQSNKSKQYDLVNPKIGPINEAIYGLGTVKSEEKFSFKVAVPKTIKNLFVHEGAQVIKGQKILSFDDGTTVTSPIEGLVFNLPYQIGENVFTDRPVVEIENLKQLFIEVVLDQQSSMRVKQSENVRISFENTDHKIFNGQVTALYHSNGQFIARVEISELPKEILPGMTADIAIEVASKESALLIPVRAVQLGTVLIQRDGKKIKVNVKLGIMDQEWAEVVSGDIKASDLILLKKAL